MKVFTIKSRAITPSNRGNWGVKAVKRMNPACEKFQSKINF
jgi:hypothetical protein